MDKFRITATVAVLGMALSLAAVTCGPVEPPGAPPDPASDSSGSYSFSDSSGSLDDPRVESRLRAIETRLAQIESRLDAQAAATESVVQAIEKLSVSLVRERGPRPDVDRDARAGKLLPEKNVRAIAALREWRSDPSIRARWMFSSAESILQVMGTPDSIDTGGEHGEYVEWEYWLPTPDGEDERLWELSFLNGQLVDCDPPKE